MFSRPLAFRDIFSGMEIDPQRAKFSCAGLVRRARVDLYAPGDLKANKPGGCDRSLELCFQQSAGNSTRPQADVGFGVFRHRCLHKNVPHLQPPARPQHARHFAQCRVFVGHQVEHAVGDHHIRPGIRHG
jgi:hypothetical protein